MTIQYINTGTSPNAGNGDTLRLAFTKINNNFLQLAENLLSSVPSAVNEYGKLLSSDGTNIIWIDAPSTLVAGTYTLALTTSGQVTINDVLLSGGSGYTGSAGAGFNFRGNWSVEFYSPGDIVTYQDVTYLCIQPWDGYPPNYAYPNGAWEIISGPRGFTGYTGSIGEGGSGSIVQSQDAPSSPTTSTLWYNTLDGRTYVYYDQSWVDANPISQGYTGSIGYVGSQGAPGEAAAIGYTGSQGIPGTAGGYTGSAGACGGIGYTGSQGDPGACGGIGYTGSQGQPGCCGGIGYTGSQGDPGACGAMGYTGSQGSAMTLISSTPPSGQTTGTFWYNSVTGRTYIRYDDAWIDSSPTSSGYTGSAGAPGSMGGPGYTGSTGQGYNFIGYWDSGYTYNSYDVVTDNNNTYFSLSDGNVGNDPQEGFPWQIMAQGLVGYTGSAGSTGGIGYTGSGGNVFDQALFTTSTVQFNSMTIRNTDDATGLIVFGDGNHEIYARFHNQFDFWEYGGLLSEDKGFRFFTGGNKYEQVERLHIANDGIQIMNAYVLPTVDGSAGQVMTTNGSGNELYWTNSLPSRITVSTSTAALANLNTATATVIGFKSYALSKLSTSVAAWVRIYSDSAGQTADASRLQTADPLPGSGVIAEVITTPGSLVQKITPGVMGVNLDDSVNSNIYITVTNLSGTTTPVTVSLTILQLEF